MFNNAYEYDCLDVSTYYVRCFEDVTLIHEMKIFLESQSGSDTRRI